MQPNQYDTLTEALHDLEDRGFTHEFEFNQTGCYDSETGHRLLPDDMKILEHHRFEGESSSGDSSVVYAVECSDGTKGSIIDSYSIYSNSFLTEFLKQVELMEE